MEDQDAQMAAEDSLAQKLALWADIIRDFMSSIDHIKVIDPPSHAHEVLEIGWFPEHALPEDIDPSHSGRILEAFRVWHGDMRAFFDRVPAIP